MSFLESSRPVEADRQLGIPLIGSEKARFLTYGNVNA